MAHAGARPPPPTTSIARAEASQPHFQQETSQTRPCRAILPPQPTGNATKKAAICRGNSPPLITFLTTRSRSLPPRAIEGSDGARRRRIQKTRQKQLFQIWMGG